MSFFIDRRSHAVREAFRSAMELVAPLSMRQSDIQTGSGMRGVALQRAAPRTQISFNEPVLAAFRANSQGEGKLLSNVTVAAPLGSRGVLFETLEAVGYGYRPQPEARILPRAGMTVCQPRSCARPGIFMRRRQPSLRTAIASVWSTRASRSGSSREFPSLSGETCRRRSA